MLFKINSVITIHNFDEDMTEPIKRLNPIRWKVLNLSLCRKREPCHVFLKVFYDDDLQIYSLEVIAIFTMIKYLSKVWSAEA